MAHLTIFMHYFHLCSFLLLPLILYPSLITCQKILRLSPIGNKAWRNLIRNPDNSFTESSGLEDFKTYHYMQTIDHFGYAPQSYATFQQKYVVSSRWWGGPDSESPIFAYLGAEEPIETDLALVGFLTENAPSFKSLSVFIEHRYYGQSIPFGTMEEAMNNVTTRGYFNSAQALADFAEILLHIKHQFSAHNSPIIVVGGSYGGMLASWFRLKYPHIALGALASSAPILYFDNITPQDRYYSIVAKDFMEVSNNCYQSIRKSWAKIDEMASMPGGLATLSKIFNTCAKLNTSTELKDFLESTYATAAQYNHPPNYPVTMVCKGIDEGGHSQSNDILGKIARGITTYLGNLTCYDTNLDSHSNIGWRWQRCSEMVMGIGITPNNTMFPEAPFNLTEFSQECEHSYGVPPRPHWITTYYGGHNIKQSLKQFGSNIIFSNGLRDPYSSGGVLEDLSETIIAVTTKNGSHCLDILKAAKTDPEWLIEQRNIETKIIQGWITQYFDNYKN